jgi:hypothetical protein
MNRLKLAVAQFNFEKKKSIIRGVISAILISGKINDDINGIVIDQDPKNRGKLKDAVDILIKSGHKKEEISCIFSPPITVYARIRRIISRTPKIIYWIATNKKEAKDGYEIFTMLLCNMVKEVISKKDVVLLVISDVSPNRYAFWAAFESCKKKVIWLQHSFDLRCVPKIIFRIDYAIIKSNEGIDFIRENMKNHSNVEFYGDVSANETRKIFIPKRIDQIGIGVNAWFRPRGEIISKIKKIISTMNMRHVNLLLHPRTTEEVIMECKKFNFFKLINNNKDFFEKSDLIIVGNSQLQIDVLMEGKPVIHTGGIDFEEYDKMEYCKMGIVWGDNKLKSIDLQALDRFYSSSLFTTKFESFLSNKKLIIDAKPIQHLKNAIELE